MSSRKQKRPKQEPSKSKHGSKIEKGKSKDLISPKASTKQKDSPKNKNSDKQQKSTSMGSKKDGDKTPEKKKKERLLLKSNINTEEDSASWSEESYLSTMVSVEFDVADEEQENELQLAQLRRLGYRKTYWNNDLECYFIMAAFVVSADSFISFSYGIRYFGVYCVLPLLICFVVVGAPVVYMELALGQYTGGNPFSVFERMAPILGGIGYLALLNNFAMMLSDIPYLLVAQSGLINALVGLQTDTPALSCFNSWNDFSCLRLDLDCSQLTKKHQVHYMQIQGRCVQTTPHIEKVVEHSRHAYARPRSPLYQYAVFHMPAVDDRFVHTPHWPTEDLLVATAFALLLVYTVSSAKGTVTFAVCAVAIVLPNIMNISLSFFQVFYKAKAFPLGQFRFDWSVLANRRCWFWAINHTFMALNLGQGTLITFGSLNKFRGNILLMTTVLASASLLVPMVTAMAVFCMLNEMLFHEMGQDVNRVAREREDWFLRYYYSKTVFVVDINQSFFYFERFGYWLAILMLLSTIFCVLANKVIRIETMVSSLTDRFALFALGGRPITHRVVLLFMFMISFNYLGYGGERVHFLLLEIIEPILAAVVVLLETASLVSLYGIRRFFCNVNLMMFGIHRHYKEKWRNKLRVYYNRLNYVVVAALISTVPLACVIVLVSTTSRMFTEMKRPEWGIIPTILMILWVPVYGVLKLCHAKRKHRLVSNELKPVAGLWGPVEEMDRRRAEYEEHQLRIKS